jgi:hypothetical protein
MSIVINDEKGTQSKLKYTNFPKQDGEVPSQRGVGPLIKPGAVVHGFEILFPAGGACPVKAVQYVKSTVKVTSPDPDHGDVTVTIDYPAGDPAATPAVAGGFAGTNFANDGPPGGTNVAGRVSAPGGADNGYWDGPGLAQLGDATSPQHPPASYDAAFLIVLIDCNNNVVDAMTFEIHIAVDATPKVVRNDRTPESKPSFTPDKPIGQSGLPIK